MAKKYYPSKDLLIAACALLAQGEHAKAGASLMKAGASPDFNSMVTAMNAEQEDAKDAAEASKAPTGMSALASIVEGMADGVNDIDDMMEDLDYDPTEGPADEDEIGIPTAPSADSVDVDVDDEEGPTVATASARTRIQRAQANIRALAAKKRR